MFSLWNVNNGKNITILDSLPSAFQNLRDINKQKSFPNSFPSSLQLTRTDYVKMYRPPVCIKTLRHINHIARTSCVICSLRFGVFTTAINITIVIGIVCMISI